MIYGGYKHNEGDQFERCVYNKLSMKKKLSERIVYVKCEYVSCGKS